MKHSIFLQSPFGLIRRAASRLRTSLSLAALGVIALLALGTPIAHAQGYGEQIIHSFQNNNTDGYSPGNLIAVNGILYGTTYNGGPYGDGTVFSIDPTTHAEKIIYSFGTNGSTDAVGPDSLVYVNGLLYGTAGGGTNGTGTIFSIDLTSHAETVLYNFTATDSNGLNPDGTGPNGPLVSLNGALYGTTHEGGTNSDGFGSGCGTVFSINLTTHAEQTLYNFGANSNDGSLPLAGLINVNGTLYGTTETGSGTSTDGSVFSIDPTTKTETIVYGFGADNTDGNAPFAGLLYVNGALYGTTQYGGSTNVGSVFSVDLTTHAEKIIHSFHAHPNDGDGGYPYDSLIDVNGTLYGTSQYGGGFSINPDGTGYQILYSFQTNSTDGADPETSLVAINGVLYGTTSDGGANGYGTVYSLTLTNAAPVAANDSYTVKYQTAYTVKAPGVLANDSSGGSTPLTATLNNIYGPENGSVTLNSDGSFTYTPNAGFAGTDSFEYQIANPTYRGNMATVTLTVQPALPTANNDSYTVAHNTTLSSYPDSVLDNDDAGGSSTITTTLVSNVSHGSLSFNSDGTFTYTPTNGYTGTDTFTYKDTNSVGTSNTATVTLTVQAPLPIAANDKYILKYATPYAVKAPGVLANDNAGGSTPLTAHLVSNVTHGTLTFNSDGSFSYTPANGFVGTDSFMYYDTNANGTSNTATVSLVVQAVVPVAHNDAYAPIYSHAYKVNAPGVLGNDYAGDTGSLTAKLVSTVSHGTLTLNSDGSFLYSPTFEYSGTDSFTYTATNAIGTSNTATVTITINPVVPIAHNDAYTPKYATAYGVSAPGVLGNDDDGGTSPMTAALVSSVTHGTLTFNSNGSFTYTPAAGFVGTDSFTYKDTTPTGTGNTATVTLNVTAALPVAHNDSYTLTHNKAFAVKAPGVLGNDYAGDSGSFTASLVSTTTHGILTFNTDGSFNYTPTTGFTGTDTFTYQAKNAIGTSNTATVTLTVQ